MGQYQIIARLRDRLPLPLVFPYVGDGGVDLWWGCIQKGGNKRLVIGRF